MGHPQVKQEVLIHLPFSWGFFVFKGVFTLSKSSIRPSKIAKVGDKISFIRKTFYITGVVENVRDNSVIVSISEENAFQQDYDTTKTVVKHSNYIILDKMAVV